MILGNAPFIAEPYFGHRSRLYDLDLHRNPDAIADIIIESYNHGVRAINLVNDDALIKGFDMALDEGCDMKVVATVGKSDVDYMNPNYDVAKEVDWEDDIELFDNYDCPLMLVDEFIVDGYDWNLTALKAIGYKELRPYLEGEMPLKEALTLLKRDSRHYAKRQLTWFRKDARIHWIEMNEAKSQNQLVDECRREMSALADNKKESE